MGAGRARPRCHAAERGYKLRSSDAYCQLIRRRKVTFGVKRKCRFDVCAQLCGTRDDPTESQLRASASEQPFYLISVSGRTRVRTGARGRLSDDGPGQDNPDLSEGLWGGRVVTYNGSALIKSAARHRAGLP